MKQEEVRKELCILHPSGLLVYRDGKVLVPRSYHHPEHFTFGTTNSKGYKQVKYQRKTYLVHRLVAECFIPNPERKPEVDHINMKKDENQVTNLRWATKAEQQNFPDQDVKDRIAKKMSMPVLQCSIDGNVVRMWESTRECHRNGYYSGAVSACCNNRFHREGNNVYKGFIWRYAEEEAI